MKPKPRRFVFPRRQPDPCKEARVDALLRIALAFTVAGRPIPGHVLRELVHLSDWWGKRNIPAAVVDALRQLQAIEVRA